MIATQTVIRAVDCSLLMVPIVVAMVPTVVIFPVLPEARGRRMLAFLRQLRVWHAELVERLACDYAPVALDPAFTTSSRSQ